MSGDAHFAQLDMALRQAVDEARERVGKAVRTTMSFGDVGPVAVVVLRANGGSYACTATWDDVRMTADVVANIVGRVVDIAGARAGRSSISVLSPRRMVVAAWR